MPDETQSLLTGRPMRQPVEVRSVVRSDGSGRTDVASWGIAVEVPIAITLNGTPWTVMLGTPADVEDLAIGVAITERILRDARHVTDVVVSEYLSDISVDLIVPADEIDTTVMRSRSLLSSTACGLCGLESLAQLHQRGVGTDRTDGTPREVADTAILRAFAALPAHQPLNATSRSLHAAAWCTLDGDIVLAREDVGRHNALDKLIGALARRDALSTPGFVVMSSRCSYELVYKAASANTQLLATISAPTSMALSWSAALSIPLACRVGGPSDAWIVRFPVEVDHAG